MYYVRHSCEHFYGILSSAEPAERTKISPTITTFVGDSSPKKANHRPPHVMVMQLLYRSCCALATLDPFNFLLYSFVYVIPARNHSSPICFSQGNQNCGSKTLQGVAPKREAFYSYYTYSHSNNMPDVVELKHVKHKLLRFFFFN